MRLVTVRTDAGTRAGRVEGDSVVLLAARDVNELLDDPFWTDVAAASGDSVALDVTRLAPVVPRPPKIICLGLNYMRHIREMGHEPPDVPTIFAKYTSALIGACDEIEINLVGHGLISVAQRGAEDASFAVRVQPDDGLLGFF